MITEGDKRARRLQLNPRPRQRNRKCHIIIPPALDEFDKMRLDRIHDYIIKKQKRER